MFWVAKNEVLYDFDLSYNGGHYGICFRKTRKQNKRKTGSQRENRNYFFFVFMLKQTPPHPKQKKKLLFLILQNTPLDELVSPLLQWTDDKLPGIHGVWSVLHTIEPYRPPQYSLYNYTQLN